MKALMNTVRDTKGITLIELVVTLSILAILVGITTYFFSTFVSKAKVENEVTSLREEFNRAFIEASKQGVAIENNTLVSRAIIISFSSSDISFWRWQDSNGNNVVEHTELDPNLEGLVDKPFMVHSLTSFKLASLNTSKMPCNNSALSLLSPADLDSCPANIQGKCLVISSKGFPVLKTSNPTVQELTLAIPLESSSGLGAVTINIVGITNACRYDGVNWIGL